MLLDNGGLGRGGEGGGIPLWKISKITTAPDCSQRKIRTFFNC